VLCTATNIILLYVSLLLGFCSGSVHGTDSAAYVVPMRCLPRTASTGPIDPASSKQVSTRFYVFYAADRGLRQYPSGTTGHDPVLVVTSGVTSQLKELSSKVCTRGGQPGTRGHQHGRAQHSDLSLRSEQYDLLGTAGQPSHCGSRPSSRPCPCHVQIY
jgi:hypothetical protein